MARRRFFVPEIRNGLAALAGEDAHHLTRVLRVEAGQKYEISNNCEVWLAEVKTARKDRVEFRALERVETAEPRVCVALYAALIRFERMELLVEKATELGVEAMTFFAAERSEKGLDRAAEKRLERWRRIAREASEQSRRARLPEIRGPVAWREAIEGAEGARLLLDEAPGATGILTVEQTDRMSVLVGPEGGWTERERAAALEAGWVPVSLGPWILRAETAAIAALAAINAACST